MIDKRNNGSFTLRDVVSDSAAEWEEHSDQKLDPVMDLTRVGRVEASDSKRVLGSPPEVATASAKSGRASSIQVSVLHAST